MKKRKSRRAMLLDIVENSGKLSEQHLELTERATSLIYELVGVLVDREQVFNRESLGLNNPELINMLSVKEHDHLIYEMRCSAIWIYPGQFSKTWAHAVRKKTDDERLGKLLCDLVHLERDCDSPLKPSCNRMSKSVRKMAYTRSSVVDINSVQKNKDDVKKEKSISAILKESEKLNW